MFFFFTGRKKKRYTTGIPRVIDGTFFSLVGKDEKSWSATCKTCNKVVKGSLGINSNLIRHLFKYHPEVHELFKVHFQG